jgi:hypothetical protein
MSPSPVNELVSRLLPAAPFTPEHFAALLGGPLRPGPANDFARTYTFTLPGGPFAGGELRLNASRDGALLILQPRNPPGLGAADLDRPAWGRPRDVRPNPNFPPEGALSETFAVAGAQVSLLWTLNSRRLVNLSLEWNSKAEG